MKKSYRKLALASHPDKPGGSAARFEAVQRAHDVVTWHLEYPAARRRWARVEFVALVQRGPMPDPYGFLVAERVGLPDETEPLDQDFHGARVRRERARARPSPPRSRVGTFPR